MMLTPIQWFPGHMHKARKAVKALLPEIDLVIEVLDARIPYSSVNPMLAQLYRGLPRIKIFNKADLADPAVTPIWQDHYQADRQVTTLAVNALDSGLLATLQAVINRLVPQPTHAVTKRRILITGIPNVGKSTLINTLCDKPIAKTGNEPAVTQMIQRIQLDGHNTLFDTPGMLWPNIDNAYNGYRLAITGGIKETAFSLPDIATYACEYLLSTYPERLQSRYQLQSLPTDGPYPDLETLELIGRKRGCLVSGGRVDLDKAARLLIHECRDGALGCLSFETPAMMAQECQAVEALRAEKAAKKQARKEAKKGGQAKGGQAQRRRRKKR